jgi:alpha-L-arabinofuranosidase
MFGNNRGTHVLATTPKQSPNTTAPLFWVASKDAQTNSVILKVSNAGPNDATANFKLSGFHVQSTASVTSLSPVNGQWNISNTLNAPSTIVPQTASIAIHQSTGFSFTFKPYQVSVFRLKPTTKL